MINVYFDNWFLNCVGFYPIRLKGRSLDVMIEKIARVAGVDPTEVKVKFVESKILEYNYNNSEPETKVVNVLVEGCMEKTLLSKDYIVSAVKEFLTSVGLDNKPDIKILPNPSEITEVYPDGTLVRIISYIR